jgi:hypothetical protein
VVALLVQALVECVVVEFVLWPTMNVINSRDSCSVFVRLARARVAGLVASKVTREPIQTTTGSDTGRATAMKIGVGLLFQKL